MIRGNLVSLAGPIVTLALLLSACVKDEQSLGSGQDQRDTGAEAGGADARADAAAGLDVATPDMPSAGGLCNGIAQCGFPCPDGTVNPVDQNGCQHTCTCVLAQYAAAGPVALKMYATCGDPVCGGPGAHPGVSVCGTSDVAGATCTIEGARCDLRNDCNQLLVCARKDPMAQPGGCPISRRSYKTDIHYLGDDELAAYERELRALKLATWRYKHDPDRQRLGFIIDDGPSSVAVEAAGDRVDLYGYTSLAIAALQRQARQIAALEREVAALKRALSEKRRSRAAR
jgi:hypothetical protein